MLPNFGKNNRKRNTVLTQFVEKIVHSCHENQTTVLTKTTALWHFNFTLPHMH